MSEHWYSSYHWWWSRIGGRPWTYRARDVYHKFEYFIIASLFIAGFWLGKSGLVSWRWFLAIMAVYTIGYIHGHFFWGTDWKEGER